MPKPERETYERFINRFGVLPQNAAMFEDLARNLKVPKAIGMRTVLIVPSGASEVVHETWEAEGHNGDTHVDFITDDLAGFVAAVADTVTQGRIAVE